MTTRFWIKLYIEMLDNPKMARLANHLWRRAVELFLLAGRQGNDGALPPVEEMAWKLRLSHDKLLEDLQGLAKAGVVQMKEAGKWSVMNFSKWQAAVPVEERVRQFRARKAGVVNGHKPAIDYVADKACSAAIDDDDTNRYKRCNEGGEGDSTSTSDSELLDEETLTTLTRTCPIATPSALRAATLAGTRPPSFKTKMGEEWLPQTPREAMEHPDMRVFSDVSGGRIPGVAHYPAVIEAVRLVREREKLGEAGLREYLAPFWLTWSSRKRLDGRPYDPGNIAWLTEWALNGACPAQGGPKGDESWRPAVASPEETRQMLAEKEEKLKKAVPMPEEVREAMRSLARKKAGKEAP